MNLDKLTSLASRIFFGAAFALLALALLERFCNELGYTFVMSLPVLRTIPTSSFIEYAAVLLVFVIALELRAIRDGLAPRDG